LRRTLSVRLSVCPSVPLLLPSVTSRHLTNYNDARAEGRISYGHLGRTSLFTMALISGADVSMRAFELQHDSFNIHRDIN